MSPINTCYEMPLGASHQYAEMQKLYDEQVSKNLTSNNGSLESLARHALVYNREPTLRMIVQLMGLNLQLATSLFTTLKGYQDSQKAQRQKGCLGPLEEQRALLARLEAMEGAEVISAALKLMLEEETMRSHVQGERGSLVAA